MFHIILEIIIFQIHIYVLHLMDYLDIYSNELSQAKVLEQDAMCERVLLLVALLILLS